MEIITQKVVNLPVYIFNTREEMGVKAAEDAALRASLINQEKLLSNILDAIKKN